MNKKLKRILTASLVTTLPIAAIGCSTTNSKLAKNIDKSMAEFVTSINKLDYVDTSAPDNKLGKIVETTAKTDTAYLTNTLNNLNVENTITRPSERTDNFKLFVLSSKPFVTLTSDDASSISTLEFSMQFSTDKIEETSDEICSKINTLILKRSILMIYVNEIYNGNVTLSEENKTAINAYVNVIKENASFLNGNRGMVKNQLSLANDLVSSESNSNLINYYIIKSGEALETRSNKIDSSISAIDSIINILETNLSPSSSYYQSKLSTTYENLIKNISDKSDNETNENKELAKKIADSLGICLSDTSENETNNNTQTNNENKDTTDNVNNNQNSQNISTYPSIINNNKINANDVTINSNTRKNTLQNDLQSDTNGRIIRNNNYPINEQNQNNYIQTNPNARNQNNGQNDQTNLTNNQDNRNTINNDTKLPRPRRVRRRARNNNNAVISTSDREKSNTAKSVTNMENENQDNTMRATRKPTSNSTEEYISSRPTSSNFDQNKATRMPYRSEQRF